MPKWDQSLYDLFRGKLKRLQDHTVLRGKTVRCTVLGSDHVKLPSEEYALMKGKDFIVNCNIDGYYGEAFTDEPRPFTGDLSDVVGMVIENSGDRAIFFAALNAAMCAAGEIDHTIHCRGSDAEKCGILLADFIRRDFGKVRVAHIGYQPGHIKATSKVFDEVYATDLNPQNIGKNKFGVEILDGSMNEQVIERVDVACVTGSALVNDTLFDVLKHCEGNGTSYIVYGVTVKGAAKLLGCDVFCPFCREAP